MGATAATLRAEHIAASNNEDNANKNVCALAVAQACRVADATRYLHTWSDLKRALSTRFSVRSIKSTFKAKTVSQFSKAVEANPQPGVLGYVVMVQGHVLLMDKEGYVIVDTDPRVADRREVIHFYALRRR